jgi:hypothetical protein
MLLRIQTMQGYTAVEALKKGLKGTLPPLRYLTLQSWLTLERLK